MFVWIRLSLMIYVLLLQMFSAQQLDLLKQTAEELKMINQQKDTGPEDRASVGRQTPSVSGSQAADNNPLSSLVPYTEEDVSI